jgi:hypothetical protein
MARISVHQMVDKEFLGERARGEQRDGRKVNKHARKVPGALSLTSLVVRVS